MTRKLPWPCSKIERDVLHELWLEAKRTGQPITVVVQEAVNAHLNRRLELTATSMPSNSASAA